MARSLPTAVWTSKDMIVWGGTPDSTGARYDPDTDRWKRISTVGAPDPRYWHTALWTGRQMIVWGGFDAVHAFDTGGRYDPTSDSWTPMTTVGAPTARYFIFAQNSSVWTGREMVVWGGAELELPGYSETGGRYDPATDQWMPTTLVGAPTPREGHTLVWTGDRVVAWGGFVGHGAHYLANGGRYDPRRDHWQKMSKVDTPTPRVRHTAVWTGSLMIVWGGSGERGYVNTGGSYDAALNSWAPISSGSR
jgi:N-acetylneuraminic acid mutarotase